MIPYFDIHVFSAVLFIIVGILLAHATWFRSSSSADADELLSSSSQLAAELSRQRRALDAQRESYEQLQSEHETTQRDWLALRRENDQLKVRDRERQRQWSRHDSSLRRLQEFKHEALIGLEQERHRRATVESGLRSANAQIAQLQSQLSAIDDDGIASDALRRVQDQQSQQRRLWEDQQRALNLELAELKQQLIENSEGKQVEDRTVERLRRERDEIRRSQCEEARQRRELEESVKAKERVIKQLSVDSQLLKSMRAKQSTFQATREADIQQIKTLRDKVQRLQDDNETNVAQISSLKESLEAARATIDTCGNEDRDRIRSLHEQREKIIALEAALAAGARKAQSLQEELQAFAKLQDQHVAAQDALREATDRLRKVTADRDELQKSIHVVGEQTRQRDLQVEQLQVENQRLRNQHDEAIKKNADHQTSARQLNQQIHSRQQSLEQMHRHHDETAKKMTAQQQRLTALQAELAIARERATSFELQAQSLDGLRARQQGFQRSLQECANRLKLATEERDRKAADLESSREEIASTRSRLAQLESKQIQEARQAKEQLIALRQRRKRTGVREVPEVSYPGKTRRDKQLGVVYTEEPEQKDDLKRIEGITQVVEQRLNDFGVHTYRQIMEWDSIAVREFSRLLAIEGRILNDDWMGQARSLHARYHGKAA